MCTRIDKKIDVLPCQEFDSTREREYLLFAWASSFLEIDRSFFPSSIFNNVVKPTVWLINGV